VAKIQIHPITLEAAKEVASNLIPSDYREVTEGYGYQIKDIPKNSLTTNSVYFTMPNGKTAGIAGVGENGHIWMLCTPTIYDYPISFSREAKRFVLNRPERLLWNIVDKRNLTHIKLLRFMGFKFLNEITHGPNNLPFIEFCKIQC